MAVICPTITASDETDYARQIENVKGFASRIHIDLMDGQFVPTYSISVNQIYWPDNILADIHVMYAKPTQVLDELIHLKPHMVVVHAEADIDHQAYVTRLRDQGIKAGLAILKDTTLEKVKPLVQAFDQLLVFSGQLGYQGGQADLSQLEKVKQFKQLYKDKEIAWDGGINDINIVQVVDAGVDVLNVGSYIQSSQYPSDAYGKLKDNLG